ncbi:Disease resistance-responsive (dirigent-like protein) family protein [Euphorbia peplus]|nr:Disease resistance-responsive (dirigent-like protein) family protein [Euphorbia peplus]
MTLLFIVAISSLVHIGSGMPLRETKLSVFLHNFQSGPNATVAVVAGVAGKKWSFIEFGSLIVTDNPVTETSNIKSTPVGRAQGMYATAGLDGINSQVMLTLVFSNKKYDGSTLEIQGISKQFDKIRELSVISGTGKFRYARGFATFETFFVANPPNYSVVRLNVTVQYPFTWTHV